jgi:exodeoxyribonuclease VII large subunit
VQGIGAVNSIVNNINKANEVSKKGLHIDTLIVGRGGGSAEDLSAFNDEAVARAIFASEIPVISAVGHEVDFSISDFVADLRAETPTAAADIAVMNTFELREDIDISKKTLISSMEQKIVNEKRIVQGVSDLLKANIRSKINEAKNTVDKCVIMLRENDPRNILSKGYAAVTESGGAVITSVKSIKIGEEYTIQLTDGSFVARAIEKKDK